MNEEFGMDNFSLSFAGAGDLFADTPVEEIEFEENSTQSQPEGGTEEPEGSQENNTAEDPKDPEEVGSEGDDNNEGNNEGASSDIYSSLAAFVHEQGLLPSLDIDGIKDIKDVDSFAKALRAEQESEAKALLDNYIANLDVKKLAEANTVISELKDVTEDYLKGNIETAKNIIREDFKNQGLSQNQINRIINKLVDLGDEEVINEALTSKDSLMEIQTKRIQDEKIAFERNKAEQIKQQEKQIADIKDAVYNKKDLIEGYNPTPVLRDQVYKNMTVAVAEDANGNPINQFIKDRMENPVDFETRMYMVYTMTNGFKNLNNLGISAKSKAVSELEKTFKNFNLKQDNTPSYVADANSYWDGDFKLNI